MLFFEERTGHTAPIFESVALDRVRERIAPVFGICLTSGLVPCAPAGAAMNAILAAFVVRTRHKQGFRENILADRGNTVYVPTVRRTWAMTRSRKPERVRICHTVVEIPQGAYRQRPTIIMTKAIYAGLYASWRPPGPRTPSRMLPIQKLSKE